MCGVVGVFGGSAGNYSGAVKESIELLNHRGPDGSGLYESASSDCVLGHTRLAILELSEAGYQPMEQGRGVLSYNGEIYNHLELREQCSLSEWKGQSDSETLAVLFEEFGNTKLRSLTGMFAGAFYDGAHNSLTLFRDSLGIKPLYWTRLTPDTIAFSSEVRPLHLLRKVASQPVNRGSKEALHSYLTYENMAEGVGFFDGIEPVLPGRTLVWEADASGAPRVEVFRSHRKQGSSAKVDLTVEKIRDEIESSVERHLLSDVPLACYMSGGLDSTTVAAVAAKRKGGDLVSYTGYFETGGEFYDEREIARIAAGANGIPLREIPIKPDDFVNRFDDVVHAIEEPRMGMGAFSQFVVAGEVAKERKVVLAGHGGDELFCGYPLHAAVRWVQNGPYTKKGISEFTRSPAKTRVWLAWTALSRMKSDSIGFAPSIFSQFKKDLSDETISAFGSSPGGSIEDQLDRYYRDTYLAGLLWVEDRISMHHSLETRLPLWSQPLCDLISGVAFSSRMKNGIPKGLWREVVSQYLPDEVINAPKRGFPTPLRVWFRRELKEFVADRLLNSECASIEEFFSRSEIENLLRGHNRIPLPFALDERRAHRIWMLLVIESWARQFSITEFN